MPSSLKNILILLLTGVQGVTLNLYSSYLSGPSASGWKWPMVISVACFLFLAALVYIPSAEDKELESFRRERDTRQRLAAQYQNEITQQMIDYNRATAEARIKAVQAGNFQNIEKLDQLRSQANG